MQESKLKFTNKTNLPEPLFRAVCADPYNKRSDYSVTELISPPRIVTLRREHQAEIVEDAADRLWSLFGQLGHLVLERSALNDYAEKRHFIERRGLSISGQLDLWKNEELIDYKFTSIWSVKDGLKPEWEQQCNLNALLCRENGVSVKSASIVVIFRDWSAGEARRNPNYPRQQVQVLSVPLWAPERQEAFLNERVEAMIEALKILPECTPTDRWARPSTWAIKKPGAARATKVFDNREDAQAACVKGMELEFRPGVQTRCLDYCPIAKWCEQFKALDFAGWTSAQNP